jgi:hypothetical protein
MGRTKRGWVVAGDQMHPTGYHDHLLYKGTSAWQAFKALYVALKNDMVVTIHRYLETR